jgi:hypothetical protein
MLILAFAAISCAGAAVCHQSFFCKPPNAIRLLAFMTYVAPLWLPIAFAAYMTGRKEITIRQLIAFGISEAFSIGFLYLSIWLMAHNYF